MKQSDYKAIKAELSELKRTSKDIHWFSIPIGKKCDFEVYTHSTKRKVPPLTDRITNHRKIYTQYLDYSNEIYGKLFEKYAQYATLEDGIHITIKQLCTLIDGMRRLAKLKAFL